MSRPPSRAAVLAIALAVAACGGPFLAIPGGRLAGDVVTTPIADWSFADETWLELETRLDDPYSVQLNYFVRDGKLYIDPAEGRTWLDHLRADPRARVRLSGKVYPVAAVLAGKPGELAGFDPERFVYRLDSRSEGGY